MSSENINQREGKPSAIKDDLVAKAARFGAFGWLAFFIMLIAFIVQNIIYTLIPQPTLATKDGTVVGQVLFDEARIRSVDDITIDLKALVQRCTSVNKHSIYEDMAICLNHMNKELADIRLDQYEANNYITNIANIGCERTSIAFNPKQTKITRDDLGYSATGYVVGEVICVTPGKKPISQAFNVELTVELTARDTNRPLGFKITNFEDI